MDRFQVGSVFSKINYTKHFCGEMPPPPPSPAIGIWYSQVPQKWHSQPLYCSWTYNTEEELDGSGHLGILGINYAGGGYYQDLSTTKAKSLELIDVLKQNLWLDRGTRAVLVDFSVYNANINLFCVIKLVVDFFQTHLCPFLALKSNPFVCPYIHD